MNKFTGPWEDRNNQNHGLSESEEVVERQISMMLSFENLTKYTDSLKSIWGK